MDISKLQIGKYKGVKVVNFPEKYSLNIESSEDPIEVIIYYIDRLSDVDAFVDLVKESNMPSDNRTIMVYEKGRKDGVNRDTIVKPFGEGKYKDFKIRRPALTSLSKELSAFVQSWEGKSEHKK